MAKFYSKSARGFFDDVIHGPRLVMVPDTSWKKTKDQPKAPLLQQENPNCKIPVDAIEITDEHYHELMAQTVGDTKADKVIIPGNDGGPKVVDREIAKVPPAELAKIELEKNDRVAMRCMKKNIALPPEWVAYDDALRAVVAGETKTMPSPPMKGNKINYPV